jgi:hypothetical protein
MTLLLAFCSTDITGLPGGSELRDLGRPTRGRLGERLFSPGRLCSQTWDL